MNKNFKVGEIVNSTGNENWQYEILKVYKLGNFGEFVDVMVVDNGEEIVYYRQPSQVFYRNK